MVDIVTDTKTLTIEVIYPDKEIEKLVNDNQLFQAVVLTTSYSEYYSTLRLKQYFEKNEINISKDKIDKFTLDEQIMWLYSHRIIPEKEYQQLMKLKKFRNEIVHGKPHVTLKIDEKKAKKVINNGVNCLKSLINLKI